MRRLSITIFFSLLWMLTFAQNDSLKLIKYDYTFYFKEGLYTDFNSFRNNSPLPFESMIYPSFTDDRFFDILDTAKIITFNNIYGVTTTIKTSEVWGYSKNGKPFKFWADKSCLIPYVGQISHFITTVMVYYSSGYNPMYDPYYYGHSSRTYQSEELRQYLIVMETGEVIDYNLKNIELLLKQDTEIFKEFTSLSKRKKNKQMFYYVRLYNEKNPVYFPE
jgi:hypothetical protein